jgi:hypothetical protein
MKTTKLPGCCYKVNGHPDLLVMKFSHYVNSKATGFKGYVHTFVATRRNEGGIAEICKGYTLKECLSRLEKILNILGE